MKWMQTGCRWCTMRKHCASRWWLFVVGCCAQEAAVQRHICSGLHGTDRHLSSVAQHKTHHHTINKYPQHISTTNIHSYWKGRPSELAGRWASFVGISAPWLTRLFNAFIQGRLQDPVTQAALANDAVDNFQRLGPTFVKIGQVASVRYVVCVCWCFVHVCLCA